MGSHMWCCSACGRQYRPDRVRYVCSCPAAGRLELRLGPVPARPVTPGERSLWRYASLLPLGPSDHGVALVREKFPAGWTTLHHAPRLGAAVGIGELWIKDEFGNPTGSLKDRASAMVVASALSLGQRVVAAASSGNAATALAAAAGAVGLPSVVFVPARASADRVRRLAELGAHVLVVDGDYDTAVRLSLAACDEWGWYCRTTAINPYTTQGKKTAGLEIAEQLAGQSPDVVVAPVGDGNILVGVHQGLRDAHRLGWIDHVPRLIAVQADGAPAVYRAWASGATDITAAPADTVAGGIAVGFPLDGARAVAAVRETGGAVVTVPDKEILAAVRTVGRLEGIRAEPSSATAVAALPGLVTGGLIRAGERVVVVNTGDGTPPVGAGNAVGGGVRIPPVLDAVRAALAKTDLLDGAPGGRRLAGIVGGSLS
ncbi:MAG TPA: threonine synthase [Pseudonocardiaceae bacterium]|nr:threonine synthase [Pseudonocardiaceae bacterium]